MGIFNRRKTIEEPKEVMPAPSDGTTWEFKIIKEADPITYSMSWSGEIYRDARPVDKRWGLSREDVLNKCNEVRNKTIAAENAEKNAEIIQIN